MTRAFLKTGEKSQPFGYLADIYLMKLFGVVVLLFLFSPVSYAQAVVPDFKDSNYYKNLNSYVEGTLKNNKNKTVSAATKKQFQTKLSNLSQTAFSGILSREKRRKDKAVADINAAFAAATASERRLADAIIKGLKASYDEEVFSFVQEFQETKRDLEDDFDVDNRRLIVRVEEAGPKLKTLKRRLKRTRKLSRQAKNGKAKSRRRAQTRKIRKSIRKTRRLKRNGRAALDKRQAALDEQIGEAKALMDTQTATSKATLDEGIAEAERDFLTDIADTKAEFDLALEDAYDIISDLVVWERNVVRNVRDRGNDLIKTIKTK